MNHLIRGCKRFEEPLRLKDAAHRVDVTVINEHFEWVATVENTLEDWC